MIVQSTNLSTPREVQWRGKTVVTGIFKEPVDEPIVLEFSDVKNDHVADRRVHGGVDKACYLYSYDHYPFWKQRYPNLDWALGMFGENLTVQGLDERNMFIGDLYKVGTALVEISQPRQPCFKLGIKFGTQSILREFISVPFSGAYVRIIEEGLVKAGDDFIPVETQRSNSSVAEIYSLLYQSVVKKSHLENALKNVYLSDQTKKSIEQRLAG